MRILICGDLHTKINILDIIRQKADKFDKIIFLGDYVDDWNTPPELSLQTLELLVDFQKANSEKVILLLGNHDISEWQGGDFRCSGYNYMTHSLVRSFFDKHELSFKLAYTINEMLFSHAGLTNTWWSKIQGFIECKFFSF